MEETARLNNMTFHEYAITKIITLDYKFGYNIISLYHHSIGIKLIIIIHKT